MENYDCFEDDFFRHNESNDFEFKQSFVNENFNKYVEIICGFLNSNGGNLIFGIKDNLEMVGLNLDRKTFDKIILRIDKIINQKIIIGMDLNKNTKFLKPQNLETSLICKKNKKFILIKIKPEINTKYQLRNNGLIYYRAGASNYCERTEKLYTQDEYENSCKMYKQKYDMQNNKNIRQKK